MGDHTQEFAVNPAAVREGVSLWLDPVIQRSFLITGLAEAASGMAPQFLDCAKGWRA